MINRLNLPSLHLSSFPSLSESCSVVQCLPRLFAWIIVGKQFSIFIFDYGDFVDWLLVHDLISCVVCVCSFFIQRIQCRSVVILIQSCETIRHTIRYKDWRQMKIAWYAWIQNHANHHHSTKSLWCTLSLIAFIQCAGEIMCITTLINAFICIYSVASSMTRLDGWKDGAHHNLQNKFPEVPIYIFCMLFGVLCLCHSWYSTMCVYVSNGNGAGNFFFLFTSAVWSDTQKSGNRNKLIASA